MSFSWIPSYCTRAKRASTIAMDTNTAARMHANALNQGIENVAFAPPWLLGRARLVW